MASAPEALLASILSVVVDEITSAICAVLVMRSLVPIASAMLRLPRSTNLDICWRVTVLPGL